MTTGMILTVVFTLFAYAFTILGSAAVFFFGRLCSDAFHRLILGFAAGVMTAAAVWSLLLPSYDQAEALGQNGLLVSVGGLILGGLILLISERMILRFSSKGNITRRSRTLFLAMTLHNIPEGMAMGLAFASLSGVTDPMFAPAAALAFGIALQNLPEGMAVSVPLQKEGRSRKSAFLMGVLSGAVEPISGVVAVFVAASLVQVVPLLLAFAAGAMIYAVFFELLPGALGEKLPFWGVLGILCGFLPMMLLELFLS